MMILGSAERSHQRLISKQTHVQNIMTIGSIWDKIKKSVGGLVYGTRGVFRRIERSILG